jgi:hypothetical protein
MRLITGRIHCRILEPFRSAILKMNRACPISRPGPCQRRKFSAEHSQVEEAGEIILTEVLEAWVGVEPTNDGFADHSLGPLGYHASVFMPKIYAQTYAQRALF